jgi:ABC-type Mn2+/Zn2+ transport system permease subunit
MIKNILKNIITGTLSGLMLAISYSSIAITLEALFALIFWGLSMSDIFEGLPNYIQNYSDLHVVPFTIIYTFTSILFAFLLLGKKYLKEEIFISICTILCLAIAISLYSLSKDIIQEPDEITRDYLNFIYRTFPSIVFTVWGYFFSRHIYRNSKQIPDD